MDAIHLATITRLSAAAADDSLPASVRLFALQELLAWLENCANGGCHVPVVG